MVNMAKKYWICIVEVDTKKPLPAGFDQRPRSAVCNVLEASKMKVDNCWSGWGTSEKRAKELLDLWNSSEVIAPIKKNCKGNCKCKK